MPRGRPRTRPEEGTEPRPVRRRGPARKPAATPAPDTFNETKSLITAILKSRGSRGATPETLQSVIAWARGVREEANTLQQLSTRQRRPKASADPDRITKNEMNRALLEGILDGTITLDVADDGTLAFTHAAAVAREFVIVDAEAAVTEDAESAIL